ncbi:putative hemolectin [Penaeus vannamei]|uniref:Putative hemolectin n=1 Tax=Penaeus vannamei TaxID=6689 RepID=A0A423T3H0_PENVA|nr:putative hemolectin [Penaeus vannamei]
MMVLVMVNWSSLHRSWVQSSGMDDGQGNNYNLDCSLEDPALKIDHTGKDLKFGKRGVVIPCSEGYASPFGGTVIHIVCQGDAWEPLPWEDPAHPACVPVCPEGCGQGRCVAPGKCECFGRSCEDVTATCKQSTFNPENMLSKTRKNEVVLFCEPGFQLTTNTLYTPLLCHQGQWLYAGVGRGEGIFCLPVTTPPCQNGGRAVEGNKCLCSGGFVGSRCQHRKCVQDPPRVKFAYYEDVETNAFVNASNETHDNATATDSMGNSSLASANQKDQDSANVSMVYDIALGGANGTGIANDTDSDNIASMSEDGTDAEEENYYIEDTANDTMSPCTRKALMAEVPQKYLVCAPGYKLQGTDKARLLVVCHDGEWRFLHASLSFEEVSCAPVLHI